MSGGGDSRGDRRPEAGSPGRRDPEVAIALDFPSLEGAIALVDLLGARQTFYKVGLELFARAGHRALEALAARDKRVFLDLKLHDIPNTVAGAVAAAGGSGVDLLTVHASGGRRMMEAATRAAESAGPRLVGVTVLTSLTADEISELRNAPVPSVEEEVVRLARAAVESGLDGVVASVLEVPAIRDAVGSTPLVVTPGIRMADGPVHDQARVAGPAEAVRLGADCLVVGRAVTAAPDPAAALRRLLDELGSLSPRD